jgi:hypothetical protein
MLLNAEISTLIASMGHGDMMVVGDADQRWGCNPSDGLGFGARLFELPTLIARLHLDLEPQT